MEVRCQGMGIERKKWLLADHQALETAASLNRFRSWKKVPWREWDMYVYVSALTYPRHPICYLGSHLTALTLTEICRKAQDMWRSAQERHLELQAPGGGPAMTSHSHSTPGPPRPFFFLLTL